MEDWLVTFGTFQSNLPAGIGAADHFLPVNRKSLVVSASQPSSRFLSKGLLLLDRYPFSLLGPSLGRFSRSQWETWLAVNGGLSYRA